MNPFTRAWRKLVTSDRGPGARVVDLESPCVRMVATADAERQRLERDLHDGVQQRLVSICLTLSLARKKARAGDVADVEEMLAQADEESRLALDELRDLARGLHPAILTNRGLGPALEDVAHRSPLTVEARLGRIARLPAPVEATAYFVAAEALANVARHARATAASIDARIAGDDLVVAIADDGRGGAQVGDGTSLAGLADRLAALGGTLSLASEPGAGTRLVARMPAFAPDAQPGEADAPEPGRPRLRRRRPLRRRLSGPGPRPAPR